MNVTVAAGHIAVVVATCKFYQVSSELYIISAHLVSSNAVYSEDFDKPIQLGHYDLTAKGAECYRKALQSL